jgi:hypothetical protein
VTHQPVPGEKNAKCEEMSKSWRSHDRNARSKYHWQGVSDLKPNPGEIDHNCDQNTAAQSDPRPHGSLQ